MLFESKEPHEVIESYDPPDSRPFVREKRAAEDELSAVIDQLATSARIVTAIALQNGLIDGSIPSDKALAELMNTGPVGFADLETFNQKNVDVLISKLKGLQLTGSTRAKDLEEMITLFESWKKRYSEVGNLNDFQLATDYFSDVQIFQSVTLDTQMFVNLRKSISDLLNQFARSVKMPAEPSKCTAILIVLSNSNNDIENFLNTFDGWISTLDKLKSLANKSFALESPQSKFVRLLEEYEAHQQSVVVFGDRTVAEVVQMINAVSGALSGSDASVADLSNLARLVTFRVLATSVAPQNFTSGFVNGHSDLKKVQADSRSSTINSLARNLDQKALENGLKPLNTLSDKTDKLETSWKTLSQPESVSAAQKVREIIGKFATIKSVAPKAAKSVANVDKCGLKPKAYTTFVSNASIVIDNALLFKTTFFVVSQKARNLLQSSLLVDLKDLVNMKNFLPTIPSVDPAEVQKQVTKFQTFKDVQKYNNTLNNLKPLVEDLAEEFAKTDLIQLIKDMSGGLTTVQGFLVDPDAKELIDYFDQLKKADEIESVAASVKLIQGIRDLQKTSLPQQISTMAGVIESSLPELKILRFVPDTIKSSQSSEAKMLMQLKSLGKEAKNFGDAMTALTNVKKVLEKGDKLEQFIIDGVNVAVEIGNLTDVSMRNELEEDWGDFGRTADEIDTLLAVLKHRRYLLVIPKASKFADYGPVFTAFSGLKDVDLRVKKRKKALETLVAQKKELDGVKKLFDELASVDLQFSRFSTLLSEMPRTLANLDLAFAQYQAPNASPPPVSQNLSRSAPSFSTATTASLFYPIVVGVVLASIACVIVVAVGVLSIREHRRAKRISKKRAYNAEE